MFMSKFAMVRNRGKKGAPECGPLAPWIEYTMNSLNEVSGVKVSGGFQYNYAKLERYSDAHYKRKNEIGIFPVAAYIHEHGNLQR